MGIDLCDVNKVEHSIAVQRHKRSMCKSPEPTFIQTLINYDLIVPENGVTESNTSLQQKVPLINHNEFNFLKITRINSLAGCQWLVTELMKNARIIAFDCEWSGIFVKQITLLQIADDDGRIYIIDLLASPEIIRYGGIDDLLSSNSIIKVIHDCRQDKINLQEQFGITLRNVFDTQVAYSYLQHCITGQPVKQIQRIGLNALYELYGAPSNPQKKGMKLKYILNPNYWAKRPLTSEMEFYAAFDVKWLIHVYERISVDMHEHNVCFSSGEFLLLESVIFPDSRKSNALKLNQSYNFFYRAIAFAVLCFAILWFVTLF